MDKQERFVARAAKIANIFLIGGGAVSLLGLVYIFYQYSWSGNRQFGSSMGMLVYHAFPALTTGLLFAALKLKPVHKINLVLVGLALVASVYGVELYLQITYSPLLASGYPVMRSVQNSKERQKLASQLAEQYGIEIDTRTRLDVITDLGRRGIDAVPSVIPRIQLKFPRKEHAGDGGDPMIALSGTSNKTTILCNESGQHVIYDSDEHGFHNPKGLWDSSRIDVVAAGDSFVQGYCVPSDKNFVAIIRQRYPATVNLGMAGEGPLLTLATIKEYARTLKSRLVLWFYFEGNDLPELKDERLSPLLMRYLEDDFSQHLLERQSESDRIILDLIQKARIVRQEEEKRKDANNQQRSRIGTAIQMTFTFIKLDFLRPRLGLVSGSKFTEQISLSSELESQMKLFREILWQARACVSSWGGTLYFVYLPNWTRYDKVRPADQSYRAAEDQAIPVLRVAGDLGIPVIDIRPAFQARSDPMSLFPFRGPGHYNEEGHRLVAEEVLKALSSSKIDSRILRRAN